MSTLLLIDGPNVLYRFGFSRGKWERTSAPIFDRECIEAFTSEMHSMIDRFHAVQTCIVWDGGLSERRLEIIKKARKDGLEMLDYKEGRHDDWRDAMKDEIEKIEYGPMLEQSGISSIYLQGREADDIIAEICLAPFWKKYGNIVIASTDKDFYQLLDDGVSIWRHMPKHEMHVTYQAFFRQYGFQGKEIALLKALTGDNSDSILGIEGVGPKTAMKWLRQSEDYTLSDLIKYMFNGSPFTVQKDKTIIQKPCKAPNTKAADRFRSVEGQARILFNLELVTLGKEKFTPEEIEQIKQCL